MFVIAFVAGWSAYRFLRSFASHTETQAMAITDSEAAYVEKVRDDREAWRLRVLVEEIKLTLQNDWPADTKVHWLIERLG
ncbi:hypothetical protein [Bradyrhizobium tropiciagri]|uniref:hypothetical protein n=1 Tax=Bradyrhizobium tropiciagri TaxID=312253 RepID=UPI00067B3041|nr:hypothetical protein [Bradyrhizobium tropiciagri]